MSAIRIGTKHNDPPLDGTKDVMEYQVHWVSIGDVVLNSADHAIMGVTYEGTDQAAVVTIRLFCSSFASVDQADRP